MDATGPVQILLVDDDESGPLVVRDVVSRMEAGCFSLEWTRDHVRGLSLIREARHDVVLVGERLAGRAGLELIREAVAGDAKAPLILLIDERNRALEAEAIRVGAADLLCKRDLDADRLERAVRHAIERETSVAALRESEARLRRLEKAVETMHLGLTVTDADGTILYVNPAAAEMVGYAKDELVGQTPRLVSPPELWKPQSREQLMVTQRWRRESINVRKDGSRFPVRLESDVVMDGAGNPIGVVTTSEDITERKRLEERLLFEMRHDSLTGALTRAAILTTLDKELARAQRAGGSVGVLLADLDHFKAVNDTLGHLAGDTALAETFQRMRATVRPYDEVGRYGGEEFLVVLPGCEIAEAVEVAERLRRAVAEHSTRTPWGEVRITMSVGVTAGRCAASMHEPLIHAADAALYRAKGAGRDRVEMGAFQAETVS